MYANVFASSKKSLYISRPVLNAFELIAWAKANGFAVTVSAEELHATQAYSKEPVDWVSMGDAPETVFVTPDWYKLERLGAEGEAVVLRFESPAFQRRFEELEQRGCSWGWPEYMPHVTLLSRREPEP